MTTLWNASQLAVIKAHRHVTQHAAREREAFVAFCEARRALDRLTGPVQTARPELEARVAHAEQVLAQVIAFHEQAILDCAHVWAVEVNAHSSPMEPR